MFIFYFVHTKHQVLLICNENKQIYVANLMIQQWFRLYILLGINIWGLRSEWVNKHYHNYSPLLFVCCCSCHR